MIGKPNEEVMVKPLVKWEKITDRIMDTPIRKWHDENGGAIFWEDGYPWADHEGRPIIEEYNAIRNGTGLLDLFSIFSFDVKGPEAEKFVQRTFTNSIEGMKPGQVRYGAIVDENGIMMDEGNLCKYADDHFQLMLNADYATSRIVKYGEGLDAKLTNVTDDFARIAVQGPTSYNTLQSIVEEDFSDLNYFKFTTEDMTIAGCKGRIARLGYSGEKGYEVYVDYADGMKVWEALVEKGGIPFGVTALEPARIEAGLMLIYEDYELDLVSPYDTSLDFAIKDVPENVGNEALKEYAKKKPLRFKTLKIEGDVLPVNGSPIIKDGVAVGTVRSSAVSPLLGIIAFAYVNTELSEDGTNVLVVAEDKLVKAEVAPICVFDPEKKKPRGPVK